MTGSDLNSSSKCWEDQEKTTTIIYEEFYEQVLIFMWKRVLLSCQSLIFYAEHHTSQITSRGGGHDRCWPLGHLQTLEPANAHCHHTVRGILRPGRQRNGVRSGSGTGHEPDLYWPTSTASGHTSFVRWHLFQCCIYVGMAWNKLGCWFFLVLMYFAGRCGKGARMETYSFVW